MEKKCFENGYQIHRFLSCNGKNISTRYNAWTNVLHSTLNIVHNIITPN